MIKFVPLPSPGRTGTLVCPKFDRMSLIACETGRSLSPLPDSSSAALRGQFRHAVSEHQKGAPKKDMGPPHAKETTKERL